MPGTSEHYNASFSLLVCSSVVTLSQEKVETCCHFLDCLLAKIFAHTRLTPVILADVHNNRPWQLLEGSAGYLLPSEYPVL